MSKSLIRKRPDSPHWQAYFTVKIPNRSPIRVRRSTGFAEEEKAKAVAARWYNEILNGELWQQKPEITIDAASARYLLEVAEHLSSAETIEYHLSHFTRIFGKATLLSQLTDSMISNYVAQRRREKGRSGNLISPLTINRELKTLQSFVNTVKEKWEYSVANVNYKKHRLAEPDLRTRWLTTKEAKKLVDCSPEHLKGIILCALYTGMRRANITSLRWGNIDLENKEVHLKVKDLRPGGKNLTLPIVTEFYEYLTKHRPENAKDEDYVFTYLGKPVKDIKKSFKTALKEAKIKDFRFHDLRHTAATWMVNAGVPLDLVQEVLGHADIKTTRRYAHRKTSERRKAMLAALKMGK